MHPSLAATSAYNFVQSDDEHVFYVIPIPQELAKGRTTPPVRRGRLFRMKALNFLERIYV
jgi:hypothetical protein